MITVLSILIPTIPERDNKFSHILNKVLLQADHLSAWHHTLGNVEVIWDDSKSFRNGGLSIGKKREALVKRATGKYLCFLDDDEDIAPNYVETLVRLCQKHYDIITFRSFIKNDFYWGLVDMSLKNQTNEEATPEKIIKRTPWHICPVLSKYAKMYDFEDINYGEDWKWFEKVLRHCQSEAHTDQILHSYQHSSKTSEADKITQHELLPK